MQWGIREAKARPRNHQVWEAPASQESLLPYWSHYFYTQCYIPGEESKVLRMKCKMKLRFQGPEHSPLHHLTAFAESDSTITDENWSWEEACKIFNALWIVKTSAWLISIWGIGIEKRHMNFLSFPQSTPPIADFWDKGFNDASTFHFKELAGDGIHKVSCV